MTIQYAVTNIPCNIMLCPSTCSVILLLQNY